MRKGIVRTQSVMLQCNDYEQRFSFLIPNFSFYSHGAPHGLFVSVQPIA